jgi:hypothetical protein
MGDRRLVVRLDAAHAEAQEELADEERLRALLGHRLSIVPSLLQLKAAMGISQ